MAEDENTDGEYAICERGGCPGSPQRLAHACFNLGVGSAGLSHWTCAIKPQTLSNCDWSAETMEVSASVTFPGQIGSSIFVGILHWAKSTGSFTSSRCWQTPTESSPEAGPQDLSLLWSYNYVSLVALALEFPLLLLQFGFHTVIIYFRLFGFALITWQWTCLSACHL